MRRFLPLLLAPLLVFASCSKEEDAPVAAAVVRPIPELSADQKTMLEDCQDNTRVFDEGGLYALLGASVQWPRDAWGGATPLQVMETVNPVSKEKTKTLLVESEPAKHRGEATLIEGTLIATQPGVPGSPSGTLSRPDPRWGGSVNCWVIRIGRTQYDPQAMVYFPSDGRPMPPVRRGSRVRIAARFYKVYTAEGYVSDPKNKGVLVATGREDTFCAFVAGPVELRSAGLGDISPMTQAFALIMLIAMAFGGVWFIKSYMKSSVERRGFKSPSQRWQERLHREREEGVEDEVDEDLSADPAEALKQLGGDGDGDGDHEP